MWGDPHTNRKPGFAETVEPKPIENAWSLTMNKIKPGREVMVVGVGLHPFGRFPD